MIKLIEFYPLWDLPNVSPFCLKLETYLKMADIPFEYAYAVDPRKSPTGKFPAIEDNGKLICDSRIIIHYLKETYGDKLDQHLTVEQKAIALGMQRLIEESLYWGLVYSRWIDPVGWKVVCPAFFGHLKLPLRFILPMMLRKKVRRELKGQGLGRLPENQIYDLCKQDIKAVADFIKGKTFAFGDEPTSLDAIIFGTMMNFIIPPVESPLKTYALEFPHIKEYCNRMLDRYYPK